MSRFLRLFIASVFLLLLGGCVLRSHRVEQRISTAHLQDATKDQLIEFINKEANQVQTLNATVNISPAVGGSKKGQVTEYTDISGYVLVRKPGMLRMIGLTPVIRSRMFDMVSDGTNFSLSIPPQNKFIVGRNEVIHPSHSALENLRPQAIFDALLLHEIDAQNEIAVLENTWEPVLDAKSKKSLEEPDYTLDVIRKNGDGWHLSRKIIFNREDLLPNREIIYDKNGSVATDARFEAYGDYNGISFPSKIGINRPQEEYDIILEVVKAKFNDPLTDDQFQLPQPPGSQLVRLDLPESEQLNIPKPRPKKPEKKGSQHGPGAYDGDPPATSPDPGKEEMQ